MKLATVGTSFITDRFIQAAQKEGSFEVDTVFSRTAQKAQVLADKFNIPHIQSDWQALLSDPQIDVVYLATPNDTHFSLAKDLLLAKKHVIVEKPFVSDIAEFKEIMSLSKSVERYVFDAIIPVHLPNFKTLKQAVKLIGRISLCQFSMVQRSSRYAALLANEDPAIFSLEHSGGALMDLGVYPITLCVGTFGSPQSVTYQCNKYSNGIDLSGVITLRYDGFIAEASIAKDSTGLNFMSIGGDKAHIQAEKSPSMLSQILLVESNKSTELGSMQDELTMVYEIKDFYQVIMNQDNHKYEEWMAITEKTILVLDECRKHANIVFKADGVK